MIITAAFLDIFTYYLQDLIRNKARNGQNCCLLEEAYAMVSALPQRSENTHHVSLIENYPATLDVLGEPIRQVIPLSLTMQHWHFSSFPWLIVFIFFYSSYLRDLSKCGRELLGLEHPLEVTTGISFSLETTVLFANPKETATLIHRHMFLRT